MDNSASAPPLPNINLEGINNYFPNLRAPLKLGMQAASVLLIKVEEHIFSCFGAGRPLKRRGLIIGGEGHHTMGVFSQTLVTSISYAVP